VQNSGVFVVKAGNDLQLVFARSSWRWRRSAAADIDFTDTDSGVTTPQ
jgi:hypothetical protein